MAPASKSASFFSFDGFVEDGIEFHGRAPQVWKMILGNGNKEERGMGSV